MKGIIENMDYTKYVDSFIITLLNTVNLTSNEVMDILVSCFPRLSRRVTRYLVNSLSHNP